MKSFSLTLGLSAALLCAGSTLHAQYKTNPDRARFYFEISKPYSPDSYEILLADEDSSFVSYAHFQEDWKGLWRNFNTVVHEACHGYNSKIGIASGWKNNGYFITKHITIAAPKKGFFPSSYLNKVVPAEQQKEILRYNLYVSGESENSSSLQGIYGFVNEFSAYYHGTKANLELRPFIEKHCPYTDAPCWTSDFLGEMQSTSYAYYEFRLFIAWYLIYAEEHEKKIFTDFMQNQNLRVAYTLLDDQFKKLLDDYFSTRADIITKLTGAGNTIELTARYIMYKKDGSGSGTGVPDSQIEYLKSLFTEKENAMLERFRVKGVNLTNYQTFLEPLK